MMNWLNVTLMDRKQLMEQRLDVDRRERPTPMLSRYWLRGRRRGGRRDGEAANIYVDRYAFSEMFLVIGVLVLSVLDMVFTLVHLGHGGREANPIMAWALEAGGERLFIITKLASTFVGLFVLLVHVRFRRVRPLLTFAFVMYAALFVFHMYLVYMRETGQWIA
ncbi:MAG: DUF5658 family protein [Planctomycetota bacterium]|jgi:hypothetical protein